MRATSRHVKLGLLAVLTGLAALVAVFVLALQRKPTVTYHSYFDETVQGLDEGAVVKFRGVAIGRVATIRVAPDRRLIDVALAIDQQHARGLKLDTAARALRAQLVIFGITGVKLIDLDFADPQTPAPPVLAFPPNPRYIPSRPSLLGSVQNDLVTFAHQLPMLVDRTMVAIDSLDQLTRDGRGLLRDGHGLVNDTRATVAAIGVVARRASRADVPGALAKALVAIDEVSKRTVDATTEAEQTLRDVGDAARTLREFFDALEREPDMIVKGRARRGRR